MVFVSGVALVRARVCVSTRASASVDVTGPFHYKRRQILLPEVEYRHMFLMKGLTESNEFSEVTWGRLLFPLKLGTPCSIINKSSYHTHVTKPVAFQMKNFN